MLQNSVNIRTLLGPEPTSIHEVYQKPLVWSLLETAQSCLFDRKQCNQVAPLMQRYLRRHSCTFHDQLLRQKPWIKQQLVDDQMSIESEKADKNLSPTDKRVKHLFFMCLFNFFTHTDRRRHKLNLLQTRGHQAFYTCACVFTFDYFYQPWQRNKYWEICQLFRFLVQKYA